MSTSKARHWSGTRAARLCATLTASAALSILAIAPPNATAGEKADKPAGNKPDKRACFDAHAKGQVERQAHRLRSALEQFTVCSNEACPAVAREECGSWLIDIDKTMPSVVPAATDRAGQDAAAVAVSMDGQKLADRLDGRAFDADPGEHVLEFVLPDGATLRHRVVLNEGEKRRIVRVDFARLAAPSKPPPPPPPVALGPPLGAYVLGGVGVAALGSFAFFAITGKNKENDLRDACAPNCAESEVDAMDHRYLAADISLGVGVLSLGAATWLFLSHREQPGSDTSAAVRVEPVLGPSESTLRLVGRF